jgi:serine-type D-Ala-D-Ala carboxypeptidase/endopeptidase (penicillin-binding protein 4)
MTLKLQSLTTQGGKECADARELLVGVGEQPRQLRDLLHPDTRAHGQLRSQQRAQSPLDPQPFSFERERVGIAVRQRVLDNGTRRLLRISGRIEKRPNLGPHSGEAAIHSPLIIRRSRPRGMGPKAYFRRITGLCLAVVLFLLVSVSPARAVDPTLYSRLDRALAVPNVDPASTAALAVDLRTGLVVYSHNPGLALVPASNQKLPVAYTALAQLGPGYRFHTEVVGTGTLVGDVWHGNLWLRGYGDPTLEPEDLAALSADVASWGIHRVDGAVIADESWFDAVRIGPGWKPSFYMLESPPLSALVVDRGLYRGRTSGNPALAAGSLFRQALDEAGVVVAQRTRVGTLAKTGLPLARDVSEPLGDIVRFMGRESDNYTAEMLVKQLGAVYAGRGSTAAGARVMREALAAAGIPLAGVRLADGSGLSRLDRLTTNAVVALLEAGLAGGELRNPFLQSLAVAGVDGTLQNRLVSLPARGHVIAKTGTTSTASALSGFVRDRYAFSILQNGRPISSYWARLAQDRFATALAAAG